jgi:hypothetical protein
MSTLTQANKQWANRPAEERFLSLPEMHSKAVADRAISRALVTSSRKLRAVPAADNRGLVIEGAAGVQYAPTHWAFGQAAALTGAPAAYLRELPAPLAADCLNFRVSMRAGRRYRRVIEARRRRGRGRAGR